MIIRFDSVGNQKFFFSLPNGDSEARRSFGYGDMMEAVANKKSSFLWPEICAVEFHRGLNDLILPGLRIQRKSNNWLWSIDWVKNQQGRTLHQIAGSTRKAVNLLLHHTPNCVEFHIVDRNYRWRTYLTSLYTKQQCIQEIERYLEEFDLDEAQNT